MDHLCHMKSVCPVDKPSLVQLFKDKRNAVLLIFSRKRILVNDRSMAGVIRIDVEQSQDNSRSEVIRWLPGYLRNGETEIGAAQLLGCQTCSLIPEEKADARRRGKAEHFFDSFIQRHDWKILPLL